MKRRRILGAGLALALLLVAAAAAIALLIPEDRIGAMAARRAESVLGQPVSVGGARILFFPHPGVRLFAVRVGTADSGAAVAAVDRVDLTARLLPLLRGRVVVDRLALDRPRLLLQVDSAGRPNLRLLAREPAPAGEAAPTAGSSRRDIAFVIRSIEVEDGRLGFVDHRDGRAIRLDGWSQQLSLAGEIRGGALAVVDLTGEVSFDDVDVRIPGVLLPPRGLRLRLRHDASLDLTDDRLDLRSASLTVNGVTLAGRGEVRAARSNSSRNGELHFQATGVEAGELTAWLPESVRERLALADGRPIELAGTADLALDLEGSLTPDSLPDVHAAMTLAGGRARVGGESLAEDVAAEASLSRDSVTAAARGSALGEPFTITATMSSPADPTVTFDVVGAADLGRLRGLGLIPDTAAISGRVAADMGGAIPVHHRERTRLRGTVRADRVRISGIGPIAVGVPAALARFEGDAVRVDSLPLTLGPDATPLLVRGAVWNFAAGLLGPPGTPLRATLSVAADTLDLDRLLGPSESAYPTLLFARLRDRPVDGRSAADAAAEAGMRLPQLPRAEAGVRIVARRIVRNGLRYDDVEARLSLTPERLRVDSARARFMGGAVSGSGELRPLRHDSAGAPIEALLAADYAVQAVGAAPFFDRLTPFRDHLTGALDLTGTVRMTLDGSALPLRETVQAGGTAELSDGRFAGWAALDSLAARLSLPGIDTLRFRDWAGSFGIDGTIVTLDETVLETTAFAARAAGAFDLSGALDLEATLFLPQETLARAGALGQRAGLLADASGRVPVGVRITGTAGAPRVALDLSSATGAVTDRARAAAQQEASKLVQRGAAAAAARLGLSDSTAPVDSAAALPLDSAGRSAADSAAAAVTDSLGQRADSLRAAAQEALRKRLRKLLPGGGG